MKNVMWLTLPALVCFAVSGLAKDKPKSDRKNKPPSKVTPMPTPEIVPPGMDVIKIRTSSSDNPEVPFYVRPPSGYQPGGDAAGMKHRLLLLFPFVPETGLRAIQRNETLVKLADARGWFVASPTLVVDFKKDAQDRKKAFYYPESWSGKAVVDAVEEIARKYPVDGRRLFVQGLSGGAQIAHRLGLWCPERITAVVVNASGWYEDPNPKASQVAWVITVGEADSRLKDTVAFAEKLKACGALPLLKTYIGRIHEDIEEANQIGAAFLFHVDELTKKDLGQPAGAPQVSAYNRTDHHAYVGDGRDYLYFANAPQKQATLPPEARFFLPDDVVAECWGKKGH